ncbi:MAG: DinB family protein [Saprospiraceae bacterium]|nr:DinB family protein [Saprospiraceae bacterium]
MQLSTQIAKLLRDVHFGGNWTVSDLKTHLSDVTWQQATTKVHNFNTIAALSYHIHYYINILVKVLQGGPLEGKDIYSFDHPPIASQADWEALLEKCWADAETLAQLIEQMPEEKLFAPFFDGKYGNYYRNVHGVIEHAHYHLGQIVLIKKLVMQGEAK